MEDYSLVARLYSFETKPTKMCETVEYYKIKEEKQFHKGDRYFKVKMHATHVTQVCIHSGEVKKGRNNNPGITLVTMQTFLSNYYTVAPQIQYTERCSASEFKKAFEQTVNRLKIS